jgi:15-cis-phytoene synthase/lycopene beta-cyclase
MEGFADRVSYLHSCFSFLTDPPREALFFVLTTHLILLSASLISHLHTLLLLSPPPYYPSRCPPRNPIKHIILLSRLALDPPEVDVGVLAALVGSEETLRRGSKSFTLAKLGWQREIRCGLVAVYGWCRVTVSSVWIDRGMY